MWFFHGSDADTLMNKISAQGFNRSFAGKNATMYGKGVYFARGSYYSARTTYSRPDAQGVQRMLMCASRSARTARASRIGSCPTSASRARACSSIRRSRTWPTPSFL